MQQQQQQRKQQEKLKRSNIAKIISSSFVTIFYLAIIIIFSYSSSLTSSPHATNNYAYAITQQNQKGDLSLSTLIHQGSPYFGDPSAPITIIDFSDFQ